MGVESWVDKFGCSRDIMWWDVVELKFMEESRWSLTK